MNDRNSWRYNEEKSKIYHGTQLAAYRKRRRSYQTTVRLFNETKLTIECLRYSFLLFGLLSGIYGIAFQTTSALAAQLDNNNIQRHRHETPETMGQKKSNKQNVSTVRYDVGKTSHFKQRTKRKDTKFIDHINDNMSEDLGDQKYGMFTKYKFLLLHRLREERIDVFKIEKEYDQSTSSPRNEKQLEFHLHPSEVTIAEGKRKRFEYKHRRKLQGINRTISIDYNDSNYNNELLDYQTNYEWMINEDAFQNRISNRSRQRRLSGVDNMSNMDNNYHENAVYATIPDQHDPTHQRNRRVREYYSHRHLSRFEKQYRIDNNIDLQVNWDGIYAFDVTDDDNNEFDGTYDDDTFENQKDDNISVKNQFDDRILNYDDKLFTDDDTEVMHLEEVNTTPTKKFNNSCFSDTVSSLVSIVKNKLQNKNNSYRRLTAQRTLFLGMGKSKETGSNIKSPALSTMGNTGWTLSGKQNSDLTQISTLGTKDDIKQIEQNDKKAVAEEQEAAAASAAAEHIGGQYNNYQAVPLSQGYGTHFANVWVGFPTPQRKTVIVDTGSHYTAFPCTGCTRCGGHHHTDPYFRPELSTTYHQLQCGECRDGVICENGRCLFHQAYTEGSSWEAVQVRDRFFCGGTDVLDSANPDDHQYAIDFMFGCQMSMTGLFITQLADGIMGMSAHPATLPKKLFDARKIEHNLFAMCYRRELGTSKRGVTAGSMTIGGVSNNLDTSPMVYAKNLAQVGWYTVYVKAIYIRTGGGQSARSDMDSDSKHRTIKVRLNQKVLNSGKGVIVDSGTTDTYLNKRLAKEFTRAWKAATGQAYTHSPVSLTLKQLHSLPTILIQCLAYSKDSDLSMDDFESIPGYAGKLDPLAPKDLLIAVPATSYMDYSPFLKKYTSRLYFSESVGGVLGSNTMQGHNVLFDWQNGRVGFAESSCTYDKKNTPKSVIDDRYPTDCALSTPIVTESCVDTVDHRLCANNPTNIALLGREVWTAIVLSPGNEAGISCVKAAHGITAQAATGADNNDNFDDPVVSCDGTGVCIEERPCQLTCSQFEKARKVHPETLRTNLQSIEEQRECDEPYWSACDYGCYQTKIESKQYSDGLCHQVAVEKRPCHVGACARTDPCRVPFIVHTVLGFRKGQVSKWNQHAKEILVIALTDTIDDVLQSQNKSRTFGEGDVHIVSAVDWYLEDYDDDDNTNYDTEINPDDAGESNEWGVKVVVEISIYNPTTISNRTTVTEQPGKSIDPLSSIVQNISDLVRGPSSKPQKASCHHDELYVLAKHALVTKRTFLQEAFMTLLIHKIQNQTKGEVKPAAPFGPIYALGYNISQCRLLSAWTIRTGLEEDVNYFGPPKPLSRSILVIVQNIAVLCTVFLAAILFWNYSTTACDSICGNTAATANSNNNNNNANKFTIDWDISISYFPRFRRHRGKSIDDIGDTSYVDSDEVSQSLYKRSSPKRRVGRKD